MTSHMIERQAKRAQKLLDRRPDLVDADCLFCAIITNKQPAFRVYESDHVLAFLDILPISRGHTLVIPRGHAARIDRMSDEAAGELGAALPRIARAVAKAMNQPDYNIVSNNGYCQVVDHVHFHLVPAPRLNEPKKPRTGLPDNRDELDDEDGEATAALIRKALEEDRKPRL